MDVYLMEVSPLLPVRNSRFYAALPVPGPKRSPRPPFKARRPGPQRRGRAFARHALKGAGIAAEQAAFAAGAHGKPYLTGHPGIHFSLSHSGNWAACAMDKSPVGVDLEEVGPARLPVARRTFAAEEYTYLQRPSQGGNGTYSLPPCGPRRKACSSGRETACGRPCRCLGGAPASAPGHGPVPANPPAPAKSSAPAWRGAHSSHRPGFLRFPADGGSI